MLRDLLATCSTCGVVGWSLARVGSEETQKFIALANRTGYSTRYANVGEVAAERVNFDCEHGRAGVMDALNR